MDEHTARYRQTVALESIAQSLQIIAANAPDTRAAQIRIAEALTAMATEDPLARIERNLANVTGGSEQAPAPEYDFRFG